MDNGGHLTESQRKSGVSRNFFVEECRGVSACVRPRLWDRNTQYQPPPGAHPVPKPQGRYPS